jgi:hypothetical protein
MKRLHKTRTARARQKLIEHSLPVFAIALVALAGVVFLSISRAATTVVSVEPESGEVTAPAGKISDSAASDGNAIKFGQASQGSSVFTIANLPDTQRDINQASSETNPTGVQRFNNRFTWFRDNKEKLNLQLVMQAGDLQDWDTPDHIQYTRASNGLKILEGAGIPYALTVGNHDTNAVCPGGSACPGANTSVEVRNTTTWNSYYPPSRYPGIVTYQAGKTDNAYRTYTWGGLKWMVLNYELWPRTEAVNWMKTVIAAHPGHNVILISHMYLDGNSAISTSNGGYGANSPKYVYDNVISRYPNIRMHFSGHTGNAGYREDTGANGNKIYSFLDCYHDTTNNWTRLLTIDTTRNTISTKVYAPWTNQTRTEAAANVNISNINWIR